MKTRPPVGSVSPAAMRSAVVLPHPDGPSSTTKSPSAMLRSSSASTQFWSNVLVTCSKRTSTSPSFGGRLPGSVPASLTQQYRDHNGKLSILIYIRSRRGRASVHAQRGAERVARCPVDVLPELHRGVPDITDGSLHRQQRRAPWLVQHPRLGGRGVLCAHLLSGRGQLDAGGTQDLIEPVLLQRPVVEVHEGRWQEVVHERDRLPVGETDPFQADHQRAFGELKGLRDYLAGRAHLVAQHLGRRRLAGQGQVIVEAGQLDITVDLLPADHGPVTALAGDHAPIGQVPEGGPHGGTREAEFLGQLHLVVEACAHRQGAGPDSRLQVLSQLEVQRDRAAAVNADGAELARHGQALHPPASVAPRSKSLFVRTIS